MSSQRLKSSTARARERGGAVKSILMFLLFLLVVCVLTFGAGGYFAYREANRPGPLTDDVVVTLEKGASVRAISETLSENNVIRHPELFVAITRLKDAASALKAGEYRIPAEISTWDLVDLLVEGKSILHYFTAAEGLTTAQIIKAISDDPILVGDVTLSPDEGALLPETYAFTRGQTRDQMLTTLMKAQETLLADVWEERAVELPFSTPEEAITLASIVEKETGVASERSRIAAVFVNRLKKGMRLESDPTIIYGLTGGEPLGRGLRVSEIKRETPYNTYVIKGLPPTPIANPGKDAIEAVLNPDDTSEIFFVADGSGGHAFAETLADHNRNVARWREIERQRKAEAGAP
ncbi:MAG: endolytic transglycosylase MltG [Pseudomonadota bacterium]